MSITQQLLAVEARINKACELAKRPSQQVCLVAVSKTKPLSMVLEAYDQGQRHFGENYLQDALEKISANPYKDIVWHFIGAVQSNKTRSIAENFAWVHTIEREKIAQRLNDQRPAELPPLKVCLQVNISSEANKSGVSLADLPSLAAKVNALPRLELAGLMCIPAANQPQAKQEQAFADMVKAQQQLQQTYPQLTALSMGMSADLELAIAHGATMVRIGTDIFGARN
ncbi:MAG TPA: YggS family pyridoxal phosphate-dependent enzyme [Oceanospirillaceae bacterium]|jgi:pyridoxal phosphate enzyme (YggS family)|nr:YggS family pyridoxal phosphate-dependent enzyme [Oceanospirillaceae bacterium]|tara:strand:- start:683 stop:1363 length:681 start_codon:yes stop_codon:yes gene_type:complete